MVIIFYTQHTQITASFLFQNRKSVKETFKILDEFPFFSGLKSNKENCKKACTDVKKRVKVALCGMKNIYLKKHSENSWSSFFLQHKT